MGDSFLKFLIIGDSVILNFDWKDWLKGVGVSIRTLPPRCTIMLRRVFRRFSWVRVTHEQLSTTS